MRFHDLIATVGLVLIQVQAAPLVKRSSQDPVGPFSGSNNVMQQVQDLLNNTTATRADTPIPPRRHPLHRSQAAVNLFGTTPDSVPTVPMNTPSGLASPAFTSFPPVPAQALSSALNSAAYPSPMDRPRMARRIPSSRTIAPRPRAVPITRAQVEAMGYLSPLMEQVAMDDMDMDDTLVAPSLASEYSDAETVSDFGDDEDTLASSRFIRVGGLVRQVHHDQESVFDSDAYEGDVDDVVDRLNASPLVRLSDDTLSMPDSEDLSRTPEHSIIRNQAPPPLQHHRRFLPLVRGSTQSARRLFTADSPDTLPNDYFVDNMQHVPVNPRDTSRLFPYLPTPPFSRLAHFLTDIVPPEDFTDMSSVSDTQDDMFTSISDSEDEELDRQRRVGVYQPYPRYVVAPAAEPESYNENMSDVEPFFLDQESDEDHVPPTAPAA